MSNASRDENFKPTILGVLNTNGETIIPICAENNHSLCVNDGATGFDYGPENALKDDNFVSTLVAVSSSDGKTIVPLYADLNGNLLIKST